MKHLSILGSTGSIGCNTLAVVNRFPDRFRVRALAAKTNVHLLAEQIQNYSPDMAVVIDEKHADSLKKKLGSLSSDVEVLYGEQGYRQAAVFSEAETVVTAVVGSAGLFPTLAAIDHGKTIALANKETLVMAGEIVMERAAEKEVDILPVDSEHSAIFQCLQGNRKKDVKKILLTASGGPFFKKPLSSFADITPEKALKHPTWSMGKKISIDSATMMNKGLEVIEACHLFRVLPEEIEVVIHPQSIVHSMVLYKDGSVIAQLSNPDMKGPIAYALSWPERLELGLPDIDFFQLGSLSFHRPDPAKFPCLGLAYQALHAGGAMPAVLNAANEAAVELFLNKKIRFTDIPELVKDAMTQYPAPSQTDLNAIVGADRWARDHVWEKAGNKQE